MLEDSVVANHHWHNRHFLSDAWQGLVGVQEPANRHVSVGLARQLSGPESRCVLEDGDKLVVGDELFQKCAVDVAALIALIWASASLNIARLLEPRIK